MKGLFADTLFALGFVHYFLETVDILNLSTIFSSTLFTDLDFITKTNIHLSSRTTFKGIFSFLHPDCCYKLARL